MAAKGATEGKPSGEIRALSLCVIQYHACVPMNGCQDIEFRAKERAVERIKSSVRTGPVGQSSTQFIHSWREIKKKGN